MRIEFDLKGLCSTTSLDRAKDTAEGLERISQGLTTLLIPMAKQIEKSLAAAGRKELAQELTIRVTRGHGFTTDVNFGLKVSDKHTALGSFTIVDADLRQGKVTVDTVYAAFMEQCTVYLLKQLEAEKPA